MGGLDDSFDSAAIDDDDGGGGDHRLFYFDDFVHAMSLLRDERVESKMLSDVLKQVYR